MFFLCCWLVAAVASASEGMWLPEQVPGMADDLKKQGLALPAAELADPTGDVLGAVASIGGFCSASFVSADGLLITNRHCTEGMLRYASDATHDYAHDGFAAKDRSEEKWGGPARVWVVESITDVTGDVAARVAKRKVDDKTRVDAVQRAESEIVAACEKKAGRRCEVVAFDQGASYRLLTDVELRDVRLVYVPPASVGSYGGDVDNWMWPRHAGDFAVLRVYASKDGRPADHADGNVPWRPAHHLAVSTEGVGPGDFVMVAGFPGRTARWGLAMELEHLAKESFPYDVELRGKEIAALQERSKDSPEAAARLAAPIDWRANGLKYEQGVLDDLKADPTLLARLHDRESMLDAWVNDDPTRVAKYGPALQELHAKVADHQATWKRDLLVRELFRSSDLLDAVHRAYRFSVEQKKKDDLDREPGFQERDRDDLRDRLEELDRTGVPAAERDLLALIVGEIEKLPADQRVPPVDAWVDEHGGSVDAAVAELAGATRLRDASARLALLSWAPKGFERSDDPWVKLAVATEKWLGGVRRDEDAYEGAMLRLRPVFLDAVRTWRPSAYYPDANDSLRLTFGTIQGYSPRDAVMYTPQTTVRGMVAKAGPPPFDAPQRVLDAATKAPGSRWADPDLGDVPCDFLSDLDTTGGNSGSPTLDAKGRLVGLLFDGNIESVASDWVFQPPLTRSISVDVRYVLWLLDVDGEGWIAKEMGVPDAK